MEILENSAFNTQPKGIQEDERDLLIDYYVQKVSGRLRQLRSPSENDKKRWVWELLQNAKDCVSKNMSSVDVEVIVEDEYVTFRHNGDPFTPKALNSLIWQKSGEKRGNAESTGRFGTGFLTTHTLSQNVFVESVLTDNDGVTWGVSVTLCREGERDEELREGIEKTLGSRVYNPNPTSFWTSFKYHLKTSINKESAIAGIISLKGNIFFTLAFADKINSIKLLTKEKTLLVKRSDELQIKDIKIIKFSIIEDDIQSSTSVIFADANDYNEQLSKKYKKERYLRYSAAIQVSENTKQVLPILNDTPHLYCIFPLIGTEKFHLPVVINSPDFEPVAERDRLLLAGEEFNGEKQEITNEGINKIILLNSIKLYEDILSFLTNMGWGNIHLLAKGARKMPVQERDFDKDWYKEEIQSQIRRIVLNSNIVETSNGFDKLQNIYFPEGDNKEQLKKIWEFTNDIYPNRLPKLDIVEEWSKLIWDECHSQNIKELSKQVSEFQTIEKLQKGLYWLDNFLNFIIEIDQNCLNDFALIPNVKGSFRKLDYEGLSLNSGLPDSSFTILSAFGVDWEDILINKEITSVKTTIHKGYKEFSYEINNQIKQKAKANDDTLMNSIFVLLSVIPLENIDISENFIEKRKTIWNFSKDLFPNNQLNTFEATDLDDSLWEKCDEWIIVEMIKKISSQKNIKNLCELNVNLNIEWLNNFLGFVSQYIKIDLFNQEDYIILPNQNGHFSLKSSLAKDGNIPSQLKEEVFVELGLSLKDELLDSKIDKFILEKTLTITEVATRINDLISNSVDDHRTINVVFKIISLLPNEQKSFQEDLWLHAKTFYGNKVPSSAVKLSNYHSTLWSVINNYLIDKIISDVETFKPLEIDEVYKTSICQLAEHLQNVSVEVNENWHAFSIKWLNDWIDFLCKNELLFGEIIPNQNENFCSIDIFNDNDIHEDLKSILFLLDKSEDFKNILIHSEISFKSAYSKTAKDISRIINELVKDGYRSQRDDNEFKKAIKLLVVDWFNNPMYSSDLHREYNYPKLDKINRELFEWSYEHRFELETNVLSSIDERKYLYTLNNYIREHEIPFDEVKILPKAEYDKLKEEIENLRNAAHSSEILILVSKFNLTEDRIKLLLEIEEKAKQYEGMSNYLEQSAQALIHSTGIRGEEIVFEYLTNQFGQNRVRWVSRSDKNDQGIEEHRYDFEVLAENLTDVICYIDAKATLTGENQSDKIPILIRKGTWDFIRETETSGKSVFLARVFGVKSANINQVQLLKIQYFNSLKNSID